MTSTIGNALTPSGLSSEVPSGRSTGWWGMVLFVTTEATLFATLLGSLFYLRFQFGPQWPPPGIERPELARPLLMTAILLPSSIPVILAERAIRAGKRWGLSLGLLTTLLMGSTFLSLQAIEYAEKLKMYTLTSNVYGSLFYTITGFHGLHVAVGLIMISWLLAASVRGSFGYRRHERVRLTAIYWHFVDAVWVAILLSVYISEWL